MRAAIKTVLNKVPGIAYLLRDTFTTAASAPLGSPRSCEGVGTLTLVQTDGQFSISAGKLALPAQATPVIGDLGLYGTPLARVVGRAVLGTLNVTLSTKQISSGFGWFSTNAPTSLIGNDNGFHVSNNFARAIVGGATPDSSLVAFAINTDQFFAVVLRASGAWYFLRVSGVWTLVWVDKGRTSTPLLPSLWNYDQSGTLDDFRVVDLAPLDGRFANDYGIATQRLVTPAAAATFTHTADCLIDFTMTTRPTAGSVDVFFRKQDANNYWIARVNSSGDISLQEVVAGSATQRANAAGVVSSGHRVLIIADGTTIKGYSNNTTRWTYSSASSFSTATAGEVNSLGTAGVVSECVAWPRTLQLPAGV